MKNQRASRVVQLPTGVEQDLVLASAKAPVACGLERDVERLLGLIGSGRRHPVLVGPSEVGKTARVMELARRIAQGARPAGATAVWQVSLRTLDALAGGSDDGVAQRLATILREAAASPARPIVFVRDLRTLRAFDAQHALVAALEHSGALFLGECTPAFGAWLADDTELASVTHVLRVDEATVPETRAILAAQAARLGECERIAVDDAALDRVVRHAARLMPQRRFPGKALALLDEAAREAAAQPDRRVTAARVTDRVCESLRVPRFLVDPETPLDVAALRAHLGARLVGHDEAIDAVAQCLALYKSDLADERRPLGVLLLAGPSGVGKTALAQLVAEYVFGSESRLVRVALSEHSEDWKVDQLFGQRSAQSVDARRGLLTRQLAGKPFSVLLLDELEKAHALAYKHLLRPLDEGMFVNGNDEEVSLRNTLVVLTSSAGGDAYRETGLGFARGDASHGAARAESVRKRVGDLFPGDLLDRVDRLCVCAPFGPAELHEVARRDVADALARPGVARRDVRFEVDDAVLAHAVVHASGATGPAVGARTLRRAVERLIVAPVALWLLANETAAGITVRIVLRDGAVAAVGTMSTPASTAQGVRAPEPVVDVRRDRSEIRVGAAVRGASPARPVIPSPAMNTTERVTARRAGRAPRE